MRRSDAATPKGGEIAAPEREGPSATSRSEADGVMIDMTTQVTGGRFADSVDSPLMSRNGSSFLYVR